MPYIGGGVVITIFQIYRSSPMVLDGIIISRIPLRPFMTEEEEEEEDGEEEEEEEEGEEEEEEEEEEEGRWAC